MTLNNISCLMARTWSVQNIFERLNVHLSFLMLVLASEGFLRVAQWMEQCLIEVSEENEKSINFIEYFSADFIVWCCVC